MDITGLQTFPEFYDSGTPLDTLSEWGWHSFPNPENFRMEDALKPFESHGRIVTISTVRSNRRKELRIAP